MAAGNRTMKGLAASALLALAQAAAADTLSYGGPAYGPYIGNGFTLYDSGYASGSRSGILAGGFMMTNTSSSPADSFVAWCVDIFDTVTNNKSYTSVSGADFYSGADAYKATDLERLASYVFTSSAPMDNVRSAAFQLAAWEIVN
jgi:hypothetical protein